MKGWKDRIVTLVWAVLAILSLMMVIGTSVWLFGVATTVTVEIRESVDGVTVVRETTTDNGEVIVPVVILGVAGLALIGAAVGLWRSLQRGRSR